MEWSYLFSIARGSSRRGLGVITSFGRNQTGLRDLTGSHRINEPTSAQVRNRGWGWGTGGGGGWSCHGLLESRCCLVWGGKEESKTNHESCSHDLESYNIFFFFFKKEVRRVCFLLNREAEAASKSRGGFIHIMPPSLPPPVFLILIPLKSWQCGGQ